MIVECSGCRCRYRVDKSKISVIGGRFKCKNCDSINDIELHLDGGISVDRGEPAGCKDDCHDRKSRIIVADDTAFFRIMISDLLSEAGYEVITAVDGEDALNKIKHELPDLDLVLLDMLMPKLDGFHVVEELKKGVMGKDLPILALSGVFKSDTDREHMKALGVAGYVHKDTPPEKILERIDMILKPSV